MGWVGAGMLAWAAWETWGLTGCLWIGGSVLWVETLCRRATPRRSRSHDLLPVRSEPRPDG